MLHSPPNHTDYPSSPSSGSKAPASKDKILLKIAIMDQDESNLSTIQHNIRDKSSDKSPANILSTSEDEISESDTSTIIETSVAQHSDQFQTTSGPQVTPSSVMPTLPMETSAAQHSDDSHIFPNSDQIQTTSGPQATPSSVMPTLPMETSVAHHSDDSHFCLLYTSPSPRDAHESRMPSSA